MTDSPNTVKSSRLPSGLQHPVCGTQSHVNAHCPGRGADSLQGMFWSQLETGGGGFLLKDRTCTRGP